MATIDDVKQFLDECGYYFLATEMDGQPYVRPFGAHMVYEGKLYFQTGKVKDVAAQLAANSKVEICASKPAEWLRLRGRLVEDPRIEVQEEMLDQHPQLRSMYRPGDGNTCVFFLDEATAGFFSFTEAPRIESF